MPVHLAVPATLPDGRSRTLLLHPSAHHPRLTERAGVLWFDLPRDAHTYLISKPDPALSHPPADDPFGLRPGTTCTLHWSTRLHGGNADLWWIEYDATGRVCHWTQAVWSGPQQHTWTTYPRHTSSCLALRLTGAGQIVFTSLELRQEAEETGTGTV